MLTGFSGAKNYILVYFAKDSTRSRIFIQNVFFKCFILERNVSKFKVQNTGMCMVLVALQQPVPGNKDQFRVQP